MLVAWTNRSFKRCPFTIKKPHNKNVSQACKTTENKQDVMEIISCV